MSETGGRRVSKRVLYFELEVEAVSLTVPTGALRNATGALGEEGQRLRLALGDGGSSSEPSELVQRHKSWRRGS